MPRNTAALFPLDEIPPRARARDIWPKSFALHRRPAFGDQLLLQIVRGGIFRHSHDLMDDINTMMRCALKESRYFRRNREGYSAFSSDMIGSYYGMARRILYARFRRHNINEEEESTVERAAPRRIRRPLSPGYLGLWATSDGAARRDG